MRDHEELERLPQGDDSLLQGATVPLGTQVGGFDAETQSGHARRSASGLDWRREYGRGGTEAGVARARDIANNRDLSMDMVRRMNSFSIMRPLKLL